MNEHVFMHIFLSFTTVIHQLMRHPNEVEPQNHFVLEIYIFLNRQNYGKTVEYNIYSQPGISIVERYIASYKCRRQRSAQNQSMSLLSCWPNLDNLLSHYNFFSTLKVNFPKMATVTDCDLPYLLSISSMISSFW